MLTVAGEGRYVRHIGGLFFIFMGGRVGRTDGYNPKIGEENGWGGGSPVVLGGGILMVDWDWIGQRGDPTCSR